MFAFGIGVESASIFPSSSSNSDMREKTSSREKASAFGLVAALNFSGFPCGGRSHFNFLWISSSSLSASSRVGGAFFFSFYE